MQDVMRNMAHVTMNKYAEENGIDISGTVCEKMGRGFVYVLRKQDTGETVIRCELTKDTMPKLWRYDNA